MMLPFALTVLLAGVQPQKPPDPALIRIFLQTDDGGHPEELEARRESLKHLTEALARRKKLLVIVDKEELADVEVDVRERRIDVPRVVVGIGARPGQPPGVGGPARTVELLVRVSWRTEGEDVRNKNKPFESPRGWRSAADDIANQLEKWISVRRSRIVAGRLQASGLTTVLPPSGSTQRRTDRRSPWSRRRRRSR